jgi:predicted RNase H-like HicB family nuclease
MAGMIADDASPWPTTLHYTVVRDAEGWLHASVPCLPGCQTQARTREELEGRLRDAARLYLDALRSNRMVPATFVETAELTV